MGRPLAVDHEGLTMQSSFILGGACWVIADGAAMSRPDTARERSGVDCAARMPDRPRVLVADDYADLLAAFKRLLAPSCEVVGCVADGDALFESMARLQPDVIVVDLWIPPDSGLEICRRIKHVAPEDAGYHRERIF